MQTKEQLSRLSFSNSGLQAGLPAFQLPCRQNVTHCRKEICWIICLLSRESIPAIPFGISKHPLSTRSRFLRATVGSTSSAILCLPHAHPFVAAADKGTCLMQRSKIWSRSCGLQDLLQFCDCALSCAMRLLQTKEQLSRLSFSNSGLEAGLPAFQLPCRQNVTHCRKEICWIY